jgi:hypothetical protein
MKAPPGVRGFGSTASASVGEGQTDRLDEGTFGCRGFGPTASASVGEGSNDQVRTSVRITFRLRGSGPEDRKVRRKAENTPRGLRLPWGFSVSDRSRARFGIPDRSRARFGIPDRSRARFGIPDRSRARYQNPELAMLYWRLVSGVWCLVSGVWCLASGIW